MPRARGQIDARKSEAILVAAAEVLAERGLSAPLEEVARRAKVSKQTVYNHYGSKTQLVRTLVSRRCLELTAPLEADDALDDPHATLSRYAMAMIHSVLTEPYGEIIRLSVSGSLDLPELAEIVYDTGIIGARKRLAGYISDLVAQGRLVVSDPLQAAEMFAGLAVGGLQMRVLPGQDVARDMASENGRADTVARLFLRAYAA